MSLRPDWYSTIFGFYFFAGAFVGAVALVCVMLRLTRLRAAAAREPTCRPDHAQALGRVLFAMVVFWAYIAFSQLLVYWIGDIPDEVSFFGARTRHVDGGHVRPRLRPLRPPVLRAAQPALEAPARDVLAVAGAWIFLMHFVDVYWQVLPVHDRRRAAALARPRGDPLRRRARRAPGLCAPTAARRRFPARPGAR